jgi:hypothetical protein
MAALAGSAVGNLVFGERPMPKCQELYLLIALVSHFWPRPLLRLRLLIHDRHTRRAFPDLFFGNFWLTIQNTTNRHASNAFDLIAVFISFPLARAAAAAAVAADFCCCWRP